MHKTHPKMTQKSLNSVQDAAYFISEQIVSYLCILVPASNFWLKNWISQNLKKIDFETHWIWILPPFLLTISYSCQQNEKISKVLPVTSESGLHNQSFCLSIKLHLWSEPIRIIQDKMRNNIYIWELCNWIGSFKIIFIKKLTDMLKSLTILSLNVW